MKKQRKVEKDNRGVAIYARKSRITNKGDSIGVQFKQCADYAKKELGLDEEYEFLQYEDKGLSGYFSDRPDFQRMLHDVQDGKIKAIVCYKLDRVGRKTADLIRLMDFLEMYHVNLLICSNGINTASGLYKIFIQIFAVIAEFERDTLTERIVDNMMELAKDGRWLGGNTPMGFTVRRVTTGSGKGKSAYSYLESLPEEKCMVQRLYEIFRTTRSIQSTAKQMNEEGFHTPSGATFNASTTRLVLRNPIYCTADKRSYDYFIDHDGNVFGDMIEFDGTHGLSAYNKTDQEKYEGSDSTFISPKYVQTIESKPVSEWIIAVGKHEGFIPSEQWIEVQELLEAIFRKVMEEQLRVESSEKLTVLKKQLARNEKRIADLKRLFMKIYEDNASGKLSDERFDMMSQSYDAEQKQLEEDVLSIQQEIEVQEQQIENIEKFVQKAHKYVHIEELTPYALRELVSAIYVDAPDKSSGKRVQHIHIKYDGLGYIPLDELEAKEKA